MPLTKNWKGVSVAYRRSHGAGQVLTFERWQDNVLGGIADAWPPEALQKQARGYVANKNHFDPQDADALAADLGGRISKMQSINSEDAVTYSWFGTLGEAPAEARRASVQWLYDRIGLQATATDPAVDQWARIHHPYAPGSPRGPELDARIDDAATGALVYVEAKWQAALGTGKGKTVGIPADQIELRRDSLRSDPALKHDLRPFAVLGVSEDKPDLTAWKETHEHLPPVHVAWLTWDELAHCPHHPRAAEFKRYITWKRDLAADQT